MAAVERAAGRHQGRCGAPFNETPSSSAQAVDALNTRLREALKGRGMVFNQPDVAPSALT